MDIFEYQIKSFRILLRIIKHAFIWGWENIRESPWWMLPITLVFLAVAWYVDIISALLWAIFFSFLVYKWDSRILGAVAILLLVACPILLSLDQEPWAELIAVYAFFFLVMTVTLQIIELKRIPDPQ